MAVQLYFGKQPASAAYFIGDDSAWWEQTSLECENEQVAKFAVENPVDDLHRTAITWSKDNGILYGHCMVLFEPQHRNVRLLYKVIEEQ